MGKSGMRRLGLALAVLAGTAWSAAAQEKLTVGANIGNVPWEFQDETGQFVGFEIDLVAAVAERLGAEVETVNIPFVHHHHGRAVEVGQLRPALL